MKCLFSLLAAVAFSLSLAQADLAIMPLGDSITFGAKLPNAGYRYPLYINLTKAGLGFHYVGQNPENCASLPIDQQHHNGYPGATILDIQNNLLGDVGKPPKAQAIMNNYGGYWMTSGKANGEAVNPDVILLLIGTNDVIHYADTCEAGKIQAPYKTLVDWFLKNRPNAHLILGTVLPVTRQPARQNDVVVEFNKWLKTAVPTWGPKCHLVDLYPLFLTPDGSINTTFLPDGVHPDQNGYNVLGDAWSKAIEALVAKGILKKEAPKAPGNPFEAATSGQTTIPVAHGATATPLNATAGASIAFSSSIIAGNNQLTAPVATLYLGDGIHMHQLIYLTESVTLPNIPPHKTQPFKMEFKVPQTIEPGTYWVGSIVKAPEGTVEHRFGPKITVTK